MCSSCTAWIYDTTPGVTYYDYYRVGPTPPPPHHHHHHHHKPKPKVKPKPHSTHRPNPKPNSNNGRTPSRPTSGNNHRR